MKNNVILLNGNNNSGIRLDKFLHTMSPDHSRSYFHELITDGHVMVNNQIVKKSSYSIKDSDQIVVTFVYKQPNLDPVHVDFEIIDEQEDFLIINKPAGLLVHYSVTTPDEVSLMNGVLHRYKEFKKFDDKHRPGLVHRIDKNTSGIVIVARNQQAQAELSALFKNRQIHKSYLALVNKHPDSKGSIDHPIGRHPIQRHMMSVFGIQSRPALTHYTVLTYFQNSTLIQADIVTGRTHQIRVHCAAIGHELIGDSVYGISSKRIGRQALHAWKVSFMFRGNHYAYVCSIPDDLKKLLAELEEENKKEISSLV